MHSSSMVHCIKIAFKKEKTQKQQESEDENSETKKLRKGQTSTFRWKVLVCPFLSLHGSSSVSLSYLAASVSFLFYRLSLCSALYYYYFHTKFRRKVSFGRWDTMLHGYLPICALSFTACMNTSCMYRIILASSTLETSLLVVDSYRRHWQWQYTLRCRTSRNWDFLEVISDKHRLHK